MVNPICSILLTKMLASNLGLFVTICQRRTPLNPLQCHIHFPSRVPILTPRRSYFDISVQRKLFLHLFLILVFGLQGSNHFMTEVLRRNLASADAFLHAAGLLLHIMAHTSLQWSNFKADSICLYINGLLQYLHKYKVFADNSRASNSTKQAKLRVLLVYGILAAGLVNPIIYPVGLHWSNACKPSLLGYWMLPECMNEGSQIKTAMQSASLGIPLKICVYLVNIYVWAFGYVNVNWFACVVLFIMCASSMRECIKM